MAPTQSRAPRLTLTRNEGPPNPASNPPRARRISSRISKLQAPSYAQPATRKASLQRINPSQALTPQRGPLLSLPAEIQLQIYGYLFHKSCGGYSKKYGSLGCRCGEGLSLTNCELYMQLRHKFYQHARFVFHDPRSCIRFLDRIGPVFSMDVGLISISYDAETEPEYLAHIFDQLGPFGLRNLNLVARPSAEVLHAMLNPAQSLQPYLATPLLDLPVIPPAWMPLYTSWAEQLHPELMEWVATHCFITPIVLLKSIRRLTVTGSPTPCRIDFSLYKLRENLEDLAEKNGMEIEEELQSTDEGWLWQLDVVEKKPTVKVEVRKD
jgi:hypothetical protein